MHPTAPDALLQAITTRDRAAIERLLSQNAALAVARATSGESLVLYACYLGAFELVPTLLHGRVLDACEAAALGDVVALRDRLENDDNARVLRSSDGWTPLHLAAFFGRDAAATLLIDHTAPVDAHSTNATRNAPLHAALAGAASPVLVRRLIFAGADVTAKASHGVTPLHLAASRGETALCDLLIARGADPHARMDDGTTPAQMATVRGHTELGERLAALSVSEQS